MHPLGDLVGRLEVSDDVWRGVQMRRTEAAWQWLLGAGVCVCVQFRRFHACLTVGVRTCHATMVARVLDVVVARLEGQHVDTAIVTAAL